MGIVYCARDVRLGRRVALKALAAAARRGYVAREAVAAEARAAATISHPAVATVYALERSTGACSWRRSTSKATQLRTEIDRGPLGAHEAVTIAPRVARALCAAHGAGVVHRDLKPEKYPAHVERRRQKSSTSASRTPTRQHAAHAAGRRRSAPRLHGRPSS